MKNIAVLGSTGSIGTIYFHFINTPLITHTSEFYLFTILKIIIPAFNNVKHFSKKNLKLFFIYCGIILF